MNDLLGTGAEMLDRMEAALGPYDPTQCRVFAYDGVGYVEMSSQAFDTLNIVPGMAFWIISLKTDVIPFEGMVPPDNVGYAMNLSPGWHLVGLPWLSSDIPLESIRVTDGVAEYGITDAENALTGHVMWEYTGAETLYNGYEPRDFLTHGTGYFFLVTSQNDVTVMFPPYSAGYSFSAQSVSDRQYRRRNQIRKEESPPPPPGCPARPRYQRHRPGRAD